MGFFDFFKPSPFSKAHSMLKNNDLVPQAMILKQANHHGYTSFSKKNDSSVFNDSHRDLEIKMLVVQKVNIMAAARSLSRFQRSEEICEECKLADGKSLFKQYVNLYEYYIANYHELGGPSTW